MPQINSGLIYRNSQYGPLFGGTSPDLGISDDCNKGTNHGSFPTSYNLASGDKLQTGKESYKRFTGAADNINFKIVEYEVFKVIYC